MLKFESSESRAGQSSESGLLLKCGVSALALCAVTLATPAFAQAARTTAQPQSQAEDDIDQEDGAEETTPTNDPAEGGEAIVVTGIRQSLRSSQAIKRNSDVVVDSITAEDIGALPDRSVTEALQRVPGVSISRFAGPNDPDHFSVEGSGVVVRGLTYVRSELNGRDTFTANNGRGLGFADVPAELLGGVDVFKSPSADMIEGGIAGTVNLRTRVPFDNRGLAIAGSIEGSWGDFARELTPTVSVLASNRWEMGDGSEFGVLGSFVYSRLRTRSDGIQISNFGRRSFNNGQLGPANGPGQEVFFPRGAAMRSQENNRERYGYSAAVQWRSASRDILATLQFLRSDARSDFLEHAVEIATDVVTSQGDSRPVPGTTFEFDDSGIFDNGVITGPTGWRDDVQSAPVWSCASNTGADRPGCQYSNVRTPAMGLQSNNITRGNETRNVTSDYGANVRWDATERLTLNFDYHHTDSTVNVLDAGLWTSSYQNVAIDLNGTDFPVVQFLPPEVCVGPAKNTNCTPSQNSSVVPRYFQNPSFADPANSFFRSSMDHMQDSEGNEDAFRIDGDFEFEEGSWLRSIRAGIRYADRDNLARQSTYNWGVLSEQWGNRGPVWLDEPINGTPATGGGDPGSAQAIVVPFNNFMRGQVNNPVSPDGRLFYGVNPAKNYQQYVDFAGLVVREWLPANRVPQGGASGWVPLAGRQGLVEGTPFLPGEINPISETNRAAYAMLRFGNQLGNGWRVSGNVGMRYTRTRRVASGFQVFNQQQFSNCDPPVVPPGQPVPAPTPFCQLPAQVRAQAVAFSNGALIANDAALSYDYWLPSLNVRTEVGGGLQFRFAAYKGIAPPDFGLTRNFYNISLLTSAEDINAGGGRPIFRASVGNPNLRPIQSTNFDASAEWYFSDVGQLSFAAFYKRLTGVLTNGTERLSFTNNGATFEGIVNTPVNSEDSGEIRGFEVAYQQTYDFLPGPLGGLGLNATYTFVDSSGVEQSTLSPTDPISAGQVANVDTSLLPLQGLSRHTVNFTPFYERGPLSVRLAYSWRSRFLLTVRDVIVPFAPIYGESTGQLDGSIFYSVTDNIRVGVQAVNLLNEVTRTTQVIAADENEITRAPRSWFMNDWRFTAVLRATF